MKLTTIICAVLSIALLLPVGVMAQKRKGFTAITAFTLRGKEDVYSEFQVVAKKGFLKKFLRKYTNDPALLRMNLTYRLLSEEAAKNEKVLFQVLVSPQGQCIPRRLQKLTWRLAGKMKLLVCGYTLPAT